MPIELQVAVAVFFGVQGLVHALAWFAEEGK